MDDADRFYVQNQIDDIKQKVLALTEVVESLGNSLRLLVQDYGYLKNEIHNR